MKTSICGIDCGACSLSASCAGCTATQGRPFGGPCMVAQCCRERGQESCEACAGHCELKETLIAEYNALGIPGMAPVTGMNSLKGSFVNLEYALPSGQTIRFWDDNKIYLGNQICKAGSNRCYGLTADETHLLVCEYGDNGTDPEIVLYQKRHTSDKN